MLKIKFVVQHGTGRHQRCGPVQPAVHFLKEARCRTFFVANETDKKDESRRLGHCSSSQQQLWYGSTSQHHDVMLKAHKARGQPHRSKPINLNINERIWLLGVRSLDAYLGLIWLVITYEGKWKVYVHHSTRDSFWKIRTNCYTYTISWNRIPNRD